MNQISRFFIALIGTTILIASCSEKTVEDKLETEESVAKDSLIKEQEKVNLDTFQLINYTKYFIADWKQFIELLNSKGIKYEDPHTKKILMTLNRKELRFLGKSDSVLIPESIHQNILAYSCFPLYYPAASEIPKIIIVSNKLQSYACYENGRLVRFAAANTGKERTPSFPGRYALVWKIRKHRSSLDSNWIMPFTWNFHSQAGSAFHQFVMPGRPVSHSCVRQFIDDAEWLFSWGEGRKNDSLGKSKPFSGTPVLIVDIFDFSRPKYGPWLDLISNKDGLIHLPDNPLEYEEALIPWCQIPNESKGSLINPDRFRYAEDTLRARGVIRPHVKLIESVNFNKLRRQKEAAKQRELEKARKMQEEAEQTFEEQ